MPNLTTSLPLNLLLGRLSNPVGELTQPPLSNECGAYALTATLAAFADWPESTIITYQENTNVIHQSDDFIHAKNKIYCLTGVLNPDGGANVAEGGYNSPAAIAAVAMDFSLKASVNITTAGLFALGELYPHEWSACEAVVGEQNRHIDAVYTDPYDGQVQLICAVSGPQELHMLARGSDGLYYDPNTGIRNNDWGNPMLSLFQQHSDYEFAGLWLTLSA
ncbi:hypothetical protein ymoll0001_210 [Yersinia mollaretii ATCC 43969]|uniref:Peptidase C39-like domain-containing protein n=1 Tax=Yersinia mollaretii (strain ATCC 43969 / DSM 18520 / CIP 103324 / CNY 7263 / WAIP 204) TaxID=349967 RepID=A0ABP2EEA7_YERMW|nr:hypothetical protein [Yersinia mollaretii]EEQ10320.1 hypothetical protein ymoll0001_210 [Yersinia mollaretii ATCC 43969]QKJ02438.1 hypothetical protein HRD69_05215 [Yersinia mollaretii ATCC 43969]